MKTMQEDCPQGNLVVIPPPQVPDKPLVNTPVAVKRSRELPSDRACCVSVSQTVHALDHTLIEARGSVEGVKGDGEAIEAERSKVLGSVGITIVGVTTRPARLHDLQLLLPPAPNTLRPPARLVRLNQPPDLVADSDSVALQKLRPAFVHEFPRRRLSLPVYRLSEDEREESACVGGDRTWMGRRAALLCHGHCGPLTSEEADRHRRETHETSISSVLAFVRRVVIIRWIRARGKRVERLLDVASKADTVPHIACALPKRVVESRIPPQPILGTRRGADICPIVFNESVCEAHGHAGVISPLSLLEHEPRGRSVEILEGRGVEMRSVRQGGRGNGQELKGCAEGVSDPQADHAAARSVQVLVDRGFVLDEFSPGGARGRRQKWGEPVQGDVRGRDLHRKTAVRYRC
mmetsp:Transcript_5195/g.9960  ORF Transcript_5195/g.9960 Transcript_5195/m.9960 type:complete len:406 (-) Transcript_5195:78-1295(-)